MLGASRITFEDFCLDLVNERLLCGRKELPLTLKAFAVLRHLLGRPGQLVTKDDLFKAVWPETVVSDADLTVNISQIRKALGDHPQTPRFIETVHKRGYRFIAQLHTTSPIVENQFSVVSKREVAGNSEPATNNWQPPTHVVGRETELAKLHGVLDKARAGQRQIVFITGEPGIGKTTIVDAFLARLRTDAADLWIGRGQCIDHHGAGEAYLPIFDALGQLCRASGGQRLVELLAQHAPTWLVQMPTLLNTADLDTLQRKTLGATQERMLREMADALEALTVETPVVLWLEDLHWSDYATLDLLSFLARRRRPARLTILGTYRPVEIIMREHPLKAVKNELQLHGYCEELSLGFLRETAVSKYLTVRFSSNQFPPALSRVLHRRTDGNPLFMVNVVEDWVTKGALREREQQWELTVALEELEAAAPQNLRQMIEQQIMRLRPHVQRILEAASVVGDEFSAAAVAAGTEENVINVEEQCAALVAQDHLVQARGTDEWPDRTITVRYGFVHALYREVIYAKITPSRRVQSHQRIGERLEQGYAAVTGEIAAQLALHFEQARDYSRTIRYLQQAAETAARRSAHQEGIAHLTKALTLLKTLPDDPGHAQQELDLQTALGPVLVAAKGYGAPEVGNTYTRARVLCEQVGETLQLFSALYGMWSYYGARANYKMVYELGEQMLNLTQRQQDVTSLVLGHWVMGCSVFYHLADVASTRKHVEQAIALYDAQQLSSLAFQYGYDPGVSSRCFAAISLWALGYPEQALHRSQEAIALARACSHHFSEAYALVYTAWLHLYRRDHHRAQEHAAATIALSHTQGFPYWTPMGIIFHGRALASQGQHEEGIAQMRQGLAIWKEMEAKTDLPYFLTMLAEACGENGKTKEALALIAEALEEVEKIGERFYEAELYRVKGELILQSQVRRLESQEENQKAKGKGQKAKIPSTQHLTPNIQEEAEACFHKAIEIARRQQAKMWELRATVSLSRLWQRQDKKSKARQTLEQVHQWFTEGFDTVDLQEAKALLTQLS
jgi:predicted ATPase/DNA-binding winged helix-turn-helix (wHTH) protein